jgi:hypothetical protein
MIRVAMMWISTPASIERRAEVGDELASPDLRSKLD